MNRVNNQEFRIYKGAWISKIGPHLSSKLSMDYCNNLLKEGGFLVRNTYDFDTYLKTSFWYIIKDNFNGFDELSPGFRNKVKKSLKTFDYKVVSKDFFLTVAYDVYFSALSNYRIRSTLKSQKAYIQELLQLGDEYHYWLCFDKESGEIAAYSINNYSYDRCEYEEIRAVPKFLSGSRYPLYGLLYSMNSYYLSDLKVKYVSDGTRSLTMHSNIQPFLEERFKFRKAYCHLQVHYVGWLRWFVFCFYRVHRFIPFTGKFPILMSLKALFSLEAMKRGEF